MPESSQIIITDEEIFEAHVGGKLSVELKSPLDTQRALSIAYTPGVAQVSRAIAADHTLAARYTWANRMVAVVSDGSAVLGLGDIGRGRVAAGDGGQVRAFQGVRRPRLDPDRAGHQGSRRDRGNPGAAAPDVRRGQPRGHLGAPLLRDRAPPHRGAGLPGHARRPARHRDRRAGGAARSGQGPRPRHELASRRHLRCGRGGRGMRKDPAGQGYS